MSWRTVSQSQFQQSQYHLKSKAYLIEYLINNFNFSQEVAQTLIETHNCLTMSQMLDLFLKNDQGLYPHIFLPDQIKFCKICGEPQNNHQKIIVQSISMLEKRISNIQQGPKVSCKICYIDFVQGQLVQYNGINHQICFICMNKFLKEEIMNLRVQQIRCPHCGDPLGPQVIRQFVDTLTFSKYQGFLRNLQIQKNPNLRWCPNPRCSVVIKIESKKKTIKCPKCATQICTKCNREAHPRMSCKTMFKNEIKQWENSSDIQKCKKCQALVEKISGCNHMSCSVCHYQWCWLCNATYTQAHFSPLNPFGCPGLQDGHYSEWGKCKIILWRIFMMLVIIILFPIALPIAMIGVGPAFTISMVYSYLRNYQNVGCCCKFLLVLFGIPIGLAIDPFVWIGLVIYYLPKLICAAIQYFQRRRQASEYSDDLLRRRLMRQSIQDIVSQQS